MVTGATTGFCYQIAQGNMSATDLGEGTGTSLDTRGSK